MAHDRFTRGKLLAVGGVSYILTTVVVTERRHGEPIAVRVVQLNEIAADVARELGRNPDEDVVLVYMPQRWSSADAGEVRYR